MDGHSQRREFLRTLSAVALGGVPILTIAEGCAGTRLASYDALPDRSSITIRPDEYPDLSVRYGAIAINVQGRRETIIVIRMDGDEYTAISPVCTHLGCRVQKEADFFRCPCHGSTYSITGAVVRGPAEQSLRQYETSFVGNELRINL